MSIHDFQNYIKNLNRIQQIENMSDDLSSKIMRTEADLRRETDDHTHILTKLSNYYEEDIKMKEELNNLNRNNGNLSKIIHKTLEDYELKGGLKITLESGSKYVFRWNGNENQLEVNQTT